MKFSTPPLDTVTCAWCKSEIHQNELRCAFCANTEHIACYCDPKCFKKAWPTHEATHPPQKRVFDYFSPKTRHLPVAVRHISEAIGKGVFAKRAIKKDEIVFEETPFIGSLEWEKVRPNTCSHCASTLPRFSACCEGNCGSVYCGEDCKRDAWERYHQLECFAVNQSFKDFACWCAANRWNSGMLVARAFMHMLLAHREGRLAEVLEGYSHFCTVKQEDIAKNKPNWETQKQELFKLWKTAYQLLMIHLEKCGLPPVLKQLFTFDEFQRFMGKRSLNSFNGGLFVLQSNLNHSCHPNVAVEEIPSLFRIRVRALRDIQEGEQLFQTYVAPFLGREQRRLHLERNYLFSCQCIRCSSDYNLSPEVLSDLLMFAR